MDDIEDNPKIAWRADLIIEQTQQRKISNPRSAEVLIRTMKNGRIIKTNTEKHQLGSNKINYVPHIYDYSDFEMPQI